MSVTTVGRPTPEALRAKGSSIEPRGAVLLIPPLDGSSSLQTLGLYLKKKGFDTHDVPVTGGEQDRYASTLRGASDMADELLPRFPVTLFAVGSESGGLVASRLTQPRFAITIMTPLSGESGLRYRMGTAIFPSKQGDNLDESPFAHPDFDAIGFKGEITGDFVDNERVHAFIGNELSAFIPRTRRAPVPMTEVLHDWPEEPEVWPKPGIHPSFPQYRSMDELLAATLPRRMGPRA